MKKINIYKSTILGYNDDDANGLKLGTKGYFCDYCEFYDYVEGVLKGFTRTEFLTSKENTNGDCVDTWFNYFIPADKVVFKEEKEEKKLRPFKDMKEFISTTGYGIGNIVTFKRKKDDSTEYNVLFFGHLLIKGVVVICLGSGCYSFEELLNGFLYYKDGDWKPFGIME